MPTIVTFDEIQQTLQDLRIHPITVGIPYAQAGGHVHFYFVEDSRPALFDTGLAGEWSVKRIERTLNRLGYQLSDVKRVFLTHGHLDHYGNARMFQEMGAEVYMHHGDLNKVRRLDADELEYFRDAYGAEFLAHGFPEKLIEHVESVFLTTGDAAPKLDTPTPVLDGQTFAFDRFEVRVVGVPGHTPGCVAYFLGDSGVAVTGDHLLQNISPNPLFELSRDGERFLGLVKYFESLERVMYHETLRLALPAHETFVTDVKKLATRLAAFYTRRQQKIYRMLEKPAKAFELCQTYYPRLRGLNTYLGFSEILGNLDMMEHRGDIVREFDGTRYLYRRAEQGWADAAAS